jgi:nifR3 family TIM-barrel protein
MKIGSVQVANPAVLAPLAGITDLPFRLLAKEAGCGLVCSEMISSNGLVHGSPKTLKMLSSCPEERPLSIQIFGSNPAIMAEAARMVETAGADILDINFGCSVKKVVKTGAGVALMRSPQVAEKILTSVRKAINIPLTIKIRSGWDASGDQALLISRIAETSGIDAIAVHPRTASQGFRGKAQWPVITEVKRAVSLPVIGNGDISTGEDALRMEAVTGCDGVMIGRAAIGNPWIFSHYLALRNGRSPSLINLDRRFEIIERYVRSLIDYHGEKHACRMLRSRLGWFVKGMHSSSRFRESIKHIRTESEALELILAYKSALERAMQNI